MGGHRVRLPRSKQGGAGGGAGRARQERNERERMRRPWRTLGISGEFGSEQTTMCRPNPLCFGVRGIGKEHTGGQCEVKGTEL